MDIYQRLKEDHEKQRKLAEQLATTSGDSKNRRHLWDEFKTELEAHANAEEQTFYAQLIEDPNTQEQARHSVSEHQTASGLIAELTELDMASGGWLQKFKKLQEELEHHLEEEENKVFEMAKDVLTEDAAKNMVGEFNRRKSDEVKGV